MAREDLTDPADFIGIASKAGSMIDARQFRRAAEQRFTVAEFLLQADYTLDSFYLAGYSVECILKALIMHLTPVADHLATFKRISSGARYHYPEKLAEELKILGITLPLNLVKGFRRFSWHTALRYESGRVPASEVRGYLKLAKATFDWAKGEMI